jgi:hypothetical protein
MTGGLGIQLRKEVRALLPAMLGVAAAVAATGMLAYRNSGFPHFRNDLELWLAIVHGLGVLALAALSIGQELTHGTLPGLLVQPISRHRILSLKMAVLIPVVVVLGVLADSVFVTRYLSGGRIGVPRQLLVWGPVVAAIGLVPLLTTLTRKPLGGVVFAIVIPGLVFTVSEWLYPLRDSAQAWWLTWYGTLVASGIGLLVLVRLFPRLQVAGDGSTRGPSRPARSAERRGTSPRHWLWLLVKKEIRLQYLTLSVSALYVAAAVMILVAQYENPDYMGPTFYAVTALHGVFIALLAGAMPSAEERHLGMLASQILMPRAASRQWVIKVGVTLGLTAVLAIGLPALLQGIHRPADAFRIEDEFVIGVLLATCAAMYVSSLSSNSLWALLASLPAIGLGFVVTLGLENPAVRTVRSWIPVDHRRISEVLRAEFQTDAWQARSDQLQWIRWLQADAVVWVAGAVALLMLYFAARNHRSLERSVRTIATQVTALLLMFWTATIACLVIARMTYGAIR